MTVEHIELQLNLSADQLERYYRGTARNISVIAKDGRRIQFPASAVRQFVTHDGIQGEFVIAVDESYKLIEIRRKD